MLLLGNPKRRGQGPNWAVEPYDDDDEVINVTIIIEYYCG
jgi:hypothetical protein